MQYEFLNDFPSTKIINRWSSHTSQQKEITKKFHQQNTRQMQQKQILMTKHMLCLWWVHKHKHKCKHTSVWPKRERRPLATAIATARSLSLSPSQWFGKLRSFAALSRSATTKKCKHKNKQNGKALNAIVVVVVTVAFNFNSTQCYSLGSYTCTDTHRHIYKFVHIARHIHTYIHSFIGSYFAAFYGNFLSNALSNEIFLMFSSVCKNTKISKSEYFYLAYYY